VPLISVERTKYRATRLPGRFALIWWCSSFMALVERNVPHPNVTCKGCLQLIGNRIRFKCLVGEEFDFCSDCEGKDEVFLTHAEGAHFFAKVRDSSTLDKNKLGEYRKRVETAYASFMYDPFAFHKSAGHAKLRYQPEALELTKKMLRLENKYRLSKEYLTKYAESQKDSWKTFVTEEIQQRVVMENINEADGYFTDITSGIDFLRGAVGNFPEHVEELMECANYVKYTQECKRGHLRLGDTIDGHIPLMDPVTSRRELLCDFFSKDKPLVIVASSST